MYGSACARTAALTTGSVLAGGGDFGWGFIAPGTLSRLLELKRKIGESLAQFCNAAAVDRARHVDLGMGRHMVSELGLDLTSPPGGIGDAGQHAAAGQRIDEARLPDIGAADKGDLGQSLRRERGGARRARDEPGFSGEESPGGLGKAGVAGARRGDLGR